MRPPRNHVDCFNFISGNFKFYRFSCIDITFLNQSMPMNYDKLLPFAVVPMLSFCNSRFADIDTYLSAINCMYQFCKGSAVISIHLHSIFKPISW